MEGKAGVSMESRKKMSRAKSNSPMKRTVRRAVAWLLVFCMCMANMNSAVYAAEIATSSDALMAATPSDAAATDSNAAEILMPEQTVSGEELKEEAIRAISAGHEFDFDSEIRVMKDAEGKNESYSELFKGYRSFTLFADNGNGGRLTGGNDNAYGYIVVRVDKDSYEAFEKEEGTARATGSDAADSSAAERVWSLTGDEELIFLYVNVDNGTVTFSLNIENLEADDIVVPSRTKTQRKRLRRQARQRNRLRTPTRQEDPVPAAAQEAVPEAAATFRTIRPTREPLTTARQKTDRQTTARTRTTAKTIQMQRSQRRSRRTARIRKAALTADRRITTPQIQIKRTEIQIPEMTETAEADPKTQETAEMPIPTVETPVLEADLTAVRMRAAPPIRAAAPTRAIPIRAALIPTAEAIPGTQETAEVLEAEAPIKEILIAETPIKEIPAAAPTRADPIPTARSFPNPASVFLP